MPFSRQIRSNSTSVSFAPEPTGEDLAVVGQHLLRNPVAAHRLGEVGADRPAGRSGHHAGAHDEPGVVVDPGQHLALLSVGEQDAAHDVQLPQLHGSTAFPPLEPTIAAATCLWVDQPCPPQGPVDPRARGHRLHAGSGGLVHEPAWAPVRVTPSGLEHPDLDRRGHLVRASGRTVGPIDEPSQPLVLVPTQPSVDRLA